MGRYILISYYRALVASGVTDHSMGVKKTSLSKRIIDIKGFSD